MPERPEESRSLTGLRGLAALLVMLHHFYLHLSLDQHLPMLQWLLRKGYLGVDLFFVLSGFVLTMVYGRWFDGTLRPGIAGHVRFLLRRGARLWPLHATVLVLILVPVLLGLMPPPGAFPTPRLVVANFVMIQAWGTSAELNPPAWSVSTELMAYLLFPLLAGVSARGRIGFLLCLAAVAAALVLCLAYAPPLGPARRGGLDLYFNYSVLPLLRCVAGFTLGVLAFRVGRLGLVRRAVAVPAVAPVLMAVLVGSMMGRVNDLLILSLLPWLVLALHHGSGPLHRLLARNPVHGMGVLSYATYLLHVVLLGLFPFGLVPLRLGLPLYFACTLAGAAVLYAWVERPARHVIRLWGERAIDAVWPEPPDAPPLRPGPASTS